MNYRGYMPAKMRRQCETWDVIRDAVEREGSPKAAWDKAYLHATRAGMTLPEYLAAFRELYRVTVYKSGKVTVTRKQPS